jgi:hypothetical protein
MTLSNMTSVQLSLLKYNEINQEDVTLARGEELFVYIESKSTGNYLNC